MPPFRQRYPQLGPFSSSGSNTDPTQEPVDLVHLETARVVVANPFPPVLVLGVLGIGQGFHQLLIARDATAVFGRTGAFADKALSALQPLQQRIDLNGHSLLLPVVAEIIGV